MTHAEIRAAHKRELAQWYASGQTTPRPASLAAKLAGASAPAPDGPGDALDWDEHEERTQRDVKPANDAAPTARGAARRVAIWNDIHMPWPHRPSYRAARAWHRDVRPDWLILGGDILDMEPLSTHAKARDSATGILDEIEMMVREVNELAQEAGRVTFCEGNHERRFAKYIAGATPQALKGIKGLTLEAVCRNHGLSDKVEWWRESVGNPGVRVGQFIFRHGDKQAGKFGGGPNVANTRLNKSLGVSEIFGHHHLASVAARAAHDRVAMAVASPPLADMQDYAGSDMCWPTGFTIVELDDRDWGTPYVVVIRDGRFSYGGRVYG